MKLNVISQYHPAAVLHNPRLWADMLDDWEHLPESVPHDFVVLPESELDPIGTPMFSLDTETDHNGGLGQWSVAFRDKTNRMAVVPMFGDRRLTFECPVVMHNAKYDLRELRNYNIKIKGIIHDSLIMAYCLGLGKQAPKEDSKSQSGSDMVGGLGLKYLARRHLGMTMRKWEEVKDEPNLIPEYNANDSVATFLLAEKWLPKLPEHYFTVDMPLLPVCMAIEDRGIKIDPAFLVEFGKELDSRLAQFDLPLNPFAIVELQSYVYGTLEIDPWKFTDTGAPSVDEDVLELIKDPLVEQVLEYKRLHKEKGTYVDNYIKAADVENRIHPELKQTSTSTGRLSCARPNLQNVFKKDDRVKLRALFCVPEGHKMVRMDFNQLEFRTLAAITKDATLIVALNSGKKIHQVSADELNISYDIAKTGNFAIMFKVEDWTLSQQLGITIGEAKEFKAKYFKKFPGIKRYQDDMEELIKADKKVTIPFEGRTRRIDAMYVDKWRIQQEGIKEGINMPVQGLGAYVCKKVMIVLHHKYSAPMILQVHDELLFEVEENKALEFGHWLKEEVPKMIGELGGVKFPVEIGIGNNWYEAGLKESLI